nr:hypothetical protein [uncultured Caldimonas sp.]
MNPFLDYRNLHDLSELSRREVADLLETARALRQAAEAGHPQKPLRGKNIALLCESDDATNAAQRMARAASDAGALVARIRPPDAGLADPAALRETAHLLGRLYDAIACEGVSPALVQTLQRESGVPIYDGLGGAGNVTQMLAEAMAGAESSAPATEDDRLYLLQAMLFSTIG